MSEWFEVCGVEDVPVGKGYSWEVNDRVIALFNIDGRFYAIDDACPHMGASLSAGYLDGCVVACPLHAWRFDVTDGTWCDNPRVSTDAFAVEVRGDRVFVSFEPPGPSSKGECESGS